MKDKILKIILIISFVPYALSIIYILHNMIFGMSWFFSSVRGLDAFIPSVFAIGFVLCWHIPILPICLAYQLFYLTRHLIKKHKSKKLKKEDELI